MSVGKDCANCGATVAVCNEHIAEHGRGCCSACFMYDTHNLLDREPRLMERLLAVEDAARSMDKKVTAHDAEVLELLATQTIFRSNLGQEITKLVRRMNRLEKKEAREAELLERIEQLQADVADRDQLIREMSLAAGGLLERVTFLEEQAAGIEKFLKLKRVKLKPGEQKEQLALPPPQAVPVVVEDDEPKKRRWRRGKDDGDEGEWYG